MSSRDAAKWMKICAAFTLNFEKFRENDSSYLFQAFWDECEQAYRGVHHKELEPVKLLGLVDEIILRHQSCLELELDANEDPVAGNLEMW